MARLPAAYRDILLLRYYNGYSVREISSMLHIKRIPHKSSFGEPRPLCKNI
ncbi:MAG: RNA polymerase sigma factor [Dysosmobacter sp.]